MYKNKLKLIEETKALYPPRKGVLVDILIYKKPVETSGGIVNVGVWTTVIRDIETNKLYIETSYKDRNYVCSKYISKENIVYWFMTEKKKRVKIGNSVNIHIIQENGYIENNNGRINIGNNTSAYFGKIENSQASDQALDCYLYNVVSNNF